MTAMTSEMVATAHKNQGNQYLKEHKYQQAIEEYDKALALDSNNAILYANRALANIKAEQYGAGVTDATISIKIDPSYVKAYYRRAIAYTSILDYQKALADLKVLCQKAPNDAGAKSKLIECQKLVRRQAFEKAIEVKDAPTLQQTLDIRDMQVEPRYSGPKLDISFQEKEPTVSITQEFISDLVNFFLKSSGSLPKKYVYAIILHAMRLFENEPSLVEVDVEGDDQITVCGDTHGQFYDFVNIFKTNGNPSENHMYLFNGDFVDRGSWSTETALTLYCYKILYPTKFFINRGNHETDNMNKIYGFEGECKHKYSTDNVYKLFAESFSLLPLATLIGRSYLVLHGGLFSKDGVTLEDIKNIDRFSHKQPPNNSLMMELMWTDPQPEEGRGPSKRGTSIQFGPDVTKKFCEDNGLKAVIRSHEVRMNGHSEEHDGKLITVFSAPNYCDTQGNLGAYININKSMELQFKTFRAVPHPSVKPMAYANQLMF